MATVIIDPEVKVGVDDNGVVAFNSEVTRRMCPIRIHPKDLKVLRCFLIEQGYKFD